MPNFSSAARSAARAIARLGIGAGIGAVAFVAVGQLVGLVASSCSFACEPMVAGTLGAIGGGVAGLTFRGYEPG